MATDIPIELFLSLIAFCFATAVIGIWKRIPFLMLIGGAIIAFTAVITDNIMLESFVSGNTDNSYSYNVESFTGQLALNNGGNTAHAEFVSSSSSQLLNKEINCIDILLRKASSPTGTATIGTLDSSGNIVQQFGTINVETLTTANIWYTFCLSGDNTYTILNQDRLGITYSGGNATNNVQVSQDANNPFDGVITFRQQYTVSWVSGSTADLTMRMYLANNELQITDNLYPFNEFPKILFGLIGSMILIGGALIWKMDD